MKYLVGLLAVATGCRAPSTEVGYVETESTGDEATSDEASGSTSTTITPGTDTSESSESSESASSSTTAGPAACDGSQDALCFGDDDPLCLCPGETIPAWDARILDLDGDGHDDVLAWTSGEVDVHPYVSTPDGLVAHASATLPASAGLHDVFVDASGAIRVIARRNETATEILTFVLDRGFSSDPIGTNLVPAGAYSTQRLGDFDGDGALDLAAQWEIEDDSAGLGVVFDVLGDTEPATWTESLPVSGFEFLGDRCDLDADGADDVFASLSFETGVLWGELGSPTMTVSDPLPWAEGNKRCHDLDGDGDLDIFVPAGCGDCSPAFGGYTVLEQTAPRVFEEVQDASGLGDEALGGTSRLAYLFDASERVIVSLGREGSLFPEGMPTTNVGLRRQLGPLEWDDGWYASREGTPLDLVEVVDVDHDGIDELLVLTEPIPDDSTSRELRVYARE